MVRQAAAHLANTYCLGVEAGGADGVGVGAGGAGCLGVGAGRAGCLSLSSYKDILIKKKTQEVLLHSPLHTTFEITSLYILTFLYFLSGY